MAIELKGLPAGVTAPEQIAIAADKRETEVELSAAEDAAVGKVELSAVASTKFGDKAVSADSPATSLEVKQP